MIEIGGMPILWHIMQYYASFGHTDFIVCAGYLQNVIKEWFSDYYINQSDVTFDLGDGGRVITHGARVAPWRVTVVDTGIATMTGGRVKRIAPYLANEPFFFTYGDGVCDVDLAAALAFHRAHGKLLTVTAVRPDARFGVLDLVGDRVAAFREKSRADVGWINGGFMIADPRVLDYIAGDGTVFEGEPMERLCADGELMAYRHDGFWQCMDTMRDKERLERLLATGEAPWRVARCDHAALI